MKKNSKSNGKIRRSIAFTQAVLLAFLVVFPYLPPIQAEAAKPDDTVTLTTAYGDFGGAHKLYCIDKGGLAIWGIADKGDVYEYREPWKSGAPFSQREQEYVFWGMLTLQASLGEKKANDIISAINANAVSEGKPQIRTSVTEEDLKSLIYRSDVRAKYPWLETVAANTEDYLEMAGLVGAKGGSTESGKKVPDVIAGNTHPSQAYQISPNSFTIQFDSNGADADFIQKVPIKFSNNNGASYVFNSPDGWKYTKTATSITFFNPNQQPPKALIQFVTAGTEYASNSGAYASELELFAECLQVWMCVKCSGTHRGGTTPTSPLEHHQRLVWIDFPITPTAYFATLGGVPAAPNGSGISFQVFRHKEDFTSNYNLQLYKYDSETGKPLEGARFVLYERFDDKDEIDTRRDGPGHIYEGGDPYASYHKDSPAIWDGFRKAGTLVTDSRGYASQTVEHGYHYDKTFCDGHPAPAFVSVPEPEEGADELTGESTGEILNADEIEGAQTENRSMAEAWINCVSDCESQASGDFEGVHFHWLMSDVDSREIESIAGSGGDEGSTPDGGNTSEPDADTAYEKSGCYDDMKETYKRFISLKYSYAFTEFQARDGYIRHDLHPDDLPIEIITTDSSENGANAAFAGIYSNKEKLEAGTDTYSIMNSTMNELERASTKSMAADLREPEAEKTPEFIYQKAKTRLLDIVLYDIPELEEETESDVKEESEVSKAPGTDATGDPAIEETKEWTTEETKKSTAEEAKESGSEETEEAVEEIKESSTGAAGETKSSVTGEEANAPGVVLAAEPTPSPETSSHQTALVKAFSAASGSNARETESTDTFISTAASSSEPKEKEKEEKAEESAPEKIHKENKATSSDAPLKWEKSALLFRSPSRISGNNRIAGSLFDSAYNSALTAGSSGEEADQGPSDNYSHCDNTDREGDAWRIYDHRTEGEFHINKKDLDLAAGESGAYSAYGDAQGDGTLVGAVYGLFAAEDISHPDGKTGIVYRANNLVSVATTDKNGDASFLVSTEAPGYTYDYTTGAIRKTVDGWASKAPKNLYVGNTSYDDYTEEGAYKRTYQDNEKDNGNCWIGRPLLMGDYYVKELARSEGYELSIGNKQNYVTNLGQNLEAQAPETATGYAVISSQLFADEQTGDKGDGAGTDELFFSARSKDTTGQKYDLLLSNLPAGMELYRKDVGTKEVQVTVGMGTYEKILLTNQDGSPKYLTAENDYQYPKYNADGTLMTVDIPTNYVAERFRQVAVRRINPDTAKEILERAEGVMTEDENAAMLVEEFGPDKLSYVKGKLEAVLRRNGKQTPKRINGGTYNYSSVYESVFDSGVREGDPDMYGLSGVIPGSPAAHTVYGSPVQKVSVEKQKDDGTFLTVGDAILSVLNYYDSNPFYSYGGIDEVEDSGSSFTFTIYASVSGNPQNFMVLGSDTENDSIIFHRVEYLPSDTNLPPRYIYADYSNNPVYDAFGTYENYNESMSGTAVIADATLVTDAVTDQDGNLKSKTIKENVYYRTGELVRDEAGNLIQAFEYREITKTESREVEDVKWVKLPVIRQADGTYVARVDVAYTDSFGVSHTNAGTDQTMEFKAVLKEKTVTLSEEDAAVLGVGFTAGHVMNSASYYVHVKKARAKAYLDYLNTNIQGDNTYIATVSLVYEKQDQIYQDAGTRDNPKQVLERAIRQKVKVVKDIQTTPEGSYAHNTNADSGHQDGFTTGPGGSVNAASKLPNFRFKIYLKSNLERLYRDNEGTVTWLNRDGTDVDVTGYKTAYPEKEPFGSVQKLYTKVMHKADSKTTGGRSNNVFDTAITANTDLYPYGADGLIGADQNPGYTRLLETIIETVEDGDGKTRQVEHYNYEKFFDAIQTVNHDKWDRKENPAIHNNGTTDNLVNTSEIAKDNALRSDRVRQFAITWYLTDEVKKLLEKNNAGENQAAGGSESYQDEVYDKALQQAIIKAENYLKPFFTYDLDEIYAIEWDSEAEGGTDKDRTTLSADTLYQTAGNGEETSKDGYFYGVSKYLPYGSYITVEQQPYSAALGDLYNKHYKVDKPKEILLPAVYEPGGNEASPETLHAAYEYQSGDTPEELQRKYFLRFNEEWAINHTDDLSGYVIRAHNGDGDFEVYKYGLEPDKLTGSIAYGGGTYSYAGFTMTQEISDPYKDMYEKENTASDYKSNQAVEKYYHYGSVSENGGTANNVLYQHGGATDDNNPSGFYFKDGVKTVTGELTAYDGQYAAAFVPWTVTAPLDAGVYDVADFKGYADGKFRNTFYTSRLRIEKLDSETGENILHDGAVFAIYSASREDKENSDGRVQFYKQDTVIEGSKEFLEAMGASDITPLTRSAFPWEVPYLGRYFGTVSVGTPVCEEKKQIIMANELGAKTGQFKAFTTTRDGAMFSEEYAGDKVYADQNTGYLTTPQPLGAGCYVLAEIKAPAGYVRSKPVAIEIYSDEVSYYLNGDQDNRVIAAIYEEQVTKTADNGADITNPDGTKPNGNKPQDRGDAARVYFNNTPIRLEVSKVKSSENTVFYELKGRIEGSITQLKAEYGLENLELAYNDSGKYLGYGWKKGFLDSLKQKQAVGEKIEILYEDGVFTGNAKLSRVPETADDVNRYLPGATMTLFDAVEVTLSGDREDYKYTGVNVDRDRYGNVKNIYIQKGYAGTAIKYLLDKTDPEGINEEDYRNYTYDQQEDDKGTGIWTCKTVEREDTDILFYDLGGLDVLTADKGILYSHDKTGRRKEAKNGAPIFALKNGTPYLEIFCNDYENLKYSAKDRRFENVPEGTKMYHLDSDGNRDSEVDSYTGMAYVIEETTGKLLTWPVNISKDRYGNVIAREKIKTSRIATIEADTENEYTIGTYDSKTNRLKKSVNPVLNEFGHPEYYQRSDETYRKGWAVYDRDGDYVRYRYSDSLKLFNDNAYQLKNNSSLNDIGLNPESDLDDEKLYHRQGESYLMENTWVTGEKTPDDPFTTRMTPGQTDVLKRMPAGTYIMEEIKAPQGFVKTIPIGLTVNAEKEVNLISATDQTINAYFEKLDAPQSHQIKVLDRDSVFAENQNSTRNEGKGSYTYKNIEGVKLALYPAKPVTTSDLAAHPSGYYLVKTANEPASWSILDNNNHFVTYKAQWTTTEVPEYLESIPKGFYILEEMDAPPGCLWGSMEIEIKEKEGIQYFILPNDHTKIEFFKYIEEKGKKIPIPNQFSAELALYEAVTDDKGIVTEHGVPKYKADREVERWTTEDGSSYSDFIKEYESLYKEYGSGFEKIAWKNGQTELRARIITNEMTDKQESVRQLWETSEGRQILVQVTKNLLPTGSYGFSYDYKLNYKKLQGNKVGYDTPEGNHRIDYLPFNGVSTDGTKEGYYVLVETKTPEGFAVSAPKPVIITETPDIQLYSLENKPKHLYIQKLSEDQKGIEGAELALYKAESDGSLIMDTAHLFDQWTSEASKPHYLSPLPYGIYYLVELCAPKGYEKMKPQKIEVTADSQPLINAVNILKKGVLTIEKTDAGDGDKKLEGASFEVINQETKERFILTTGENGKAVSGQLLTGTTSQQGKWEPYHYEVREIRPPKTYQLNPVRYVFTFEDNSDSSELTYSLNVPNEPTRIYITKSDFNSGLLVQGSSLAIYGTKIINGCYEAEGEALEEWISDGTVHKVEGKLTAGRVYMLKELKAPAGYNVAKPVVFTISEDGRRVVHVTDRLHMVEFQTSGSYIDGIESVTVSGRRAEQRLLQLTDLDTDKVIKIPAGKESLKAEDGLVEGHLYEEKELTCYSDGSERVDRRTIFRLHFNEEGTYRVSSSRPDKTLLRMEGDKGELIEEWIVENRENKGYSHTIVNPEYVDQQSIQVVSANGCFGAGIASGSIVTYEIKYCNDGKEKKDIKVTAILDPQTEYMPANSTLNGEMKNNSVIWTFREVLPGEQGSLRLVAAVKEDAGNRIQTTALIGEKEYTCQNPIATEGSLIITSLLSGTAQDELKERAFTYEVKLTNPDGEPVKGLCHYTGSKEGTIKSGDIIHLKGGEYISIANMAWGTRYEVKTEAEEDVTMSQSGNSGIIGRQGASSIFFYKKNDPSVREIFKKGETYQLTETTVYLDGSRVITNRLSFTLGETAVVDGIEMKDQPTHVEILKMDIDGGQLLAGAHLLLKDKSGNVIREWISTKQPYELIGVLEPGETYFLTEVSPPRGYAYARTIEFTVSKDGAVDQIRMEDQITRVEIMKTGENGEVDLPGALLEVRDKEDKLIETWVSDGSPHLLAGKLTAGAVYTLTERKSPDGYWKGRSVEFFVPEDGSLIQVEFKNKKTKIYIEKRGYSADGERDLGIVGGAEIAIFDKAGENVYQFISKEGTLHEVTGILCAGETYRAVELKAPNEYEICEPVTFTVPEYPEYDSSGEILMPVIVRLRDMKKPETPGTDSPDDPPKQDPIKPLTYGTITVQYLRDISGKGTAVAGTGKPSQIPWLGDLYSHNAGEFALYLLVSLAFILIIIRRKKQ